MKYFVTAVILLFLAANTASAQLTFTSAEYLQQASQASVTYSSNDLSGLTTLIASTGTGQSWNFGGRTYDAGVLDVRGVLLPYPSGAALANDPHFTTATHVLADTTFESGARIISYGFFRITTDGAWLLGESRDSAGVLSLAGVYTPPLQWLKFPLTYGTSWTSVSQLIIEGDTILFSRSVTADGAGTLTTPPNNSHQALRMSATSMFLYVVGTDTIPLGSSKTYEWMSKEGYSASIGTNAAGTPQSVSYTEPAGTVVVHSGAAWENGTTGDFGTVASGSTNTMTFTLVDTSAVPVTVQSVSITGANASEFSVLTTYPQTIQAGASHGIQVQWTPSSVAGTHSATLTVSLGEVGSVTLPLTGVVTTSAVADEEMAGFTVSVWPNPMSTSGRMSITSAVAGKVNWAIIDPVGRVHCDGSRAVGAGSAEVLDLPISRPDLPAGQYFFRATLGGKSITVPVAITR